MSSHSGRRARCFSVVACDDGEALLEACDEMIPPHVRPEVAPVPD
ncbi:MAG: hypothetical protein ABWY58_08935 [Aeromicrobium sp.]